MRIKLNFCLREIRTIIGIHHLTIILLGMTLRQEEGFRDPASLIDRGKIELGVHPILAFGGKDKPTAILAPVMVAIALIAVHFFEFTSRTSLQIHQP